MPCCRRVSLKYRYAPGAVDGVQQVSRMLSDLTEREKSCMIAHSFTSNFVGSLWKRSVTTIRLTVSHSYFCHAGRSGFSSSPDSSASNRRSWETVSSRPVSRSRKDEDSSNCISRASMMSLRRTVTGIASRSSCCAAYHKKRVTPKRPNGETPKQKPRPVTPNRIWKVGGMGAG